MMKLRMRCPHNKQKYLCRECKGRGICEHDRQRSTCKECRGSSRCEHGKLKHHCAECATKRCKHMQTRDNCEECREEGEDSEQDMEGADEAGKMTGNDESMQGMAGEKSTQLHGDDHTGGSSSSDNQQPSELFNAELLLGLATIAGMQPEASMNSSSLPQTYAASMSGESHEIFPNSELCTHRVPQKSCRACSLRCQHNQVAHRCKQCKLQRQRAEELEDPPISFDDLPQLNIRVRDLPRLYKHKKEKREAAKRATEEREQRMALTTAAPKDEAAFAIAPVQVFRTDEYEQVEPVPGNLADDDAPSALDTLVEFVGPSAGDDKGTTAARKKRCPHGRTRYFCRECGGKGICLHDRNRSTCKDCRGSMICIHNRVRPQCKDCGGSSICMHNRQKNHCKDCRTKETPVCEHGGDRRKCLLCKYLCKHGKDFANCRICSLSNRKRGRPRDDDHKIYDQHEIEPIPELTIGPMPSLSIQFCDLPSIRKVKGKPKKPRVRKPKVRKVQAIPDPMSFPKRY